MKKVLSSDLAHIPMFERVTAYQFEDANEDSGPRYSEMIGPGMTSEDTYVKNYPTDPDQHLTKEVMKTQKQYLKDHGVKGPNDPREMPYDNSMPSNVADDQYSPGYNFNSPAKWHYSRVNKYDNIL
ncbi:MAG: hypothetical protein KGH75_03115 [Rhodospirillales bacterium]|nr:hypothetical protein [Rhodospirillales bacterium]